MQPKILIVEDEPPIRELLKFNLNKEGYRVSTCESGEDALDFLKVEQPNLILLDLMLPGINGLDVCKEVKQNVFFNKTKIVILSALGEETDIIHGLEIGADDYIAKPFSPKVLIARIKTVLGRNGKTERNFSADVSIHGIFISPGRFEVRLKDQKIDLTVSEFKILNFLARFPGWVFTRDQIVDGVRGEDYPVTARSIDVQIVGLRKKLGEFGSIVETVRGVGYRVKE